MRPLKERRRILRECCSSRRCRVKCDNVNGALNMHSPIRDPQSIWHCSSIPLNLTHVRVLEMLGLACTPEVAQNKHKMNFHSRAPAQPFLVIKWTWKLSHRQTPAHSNYREVNFSFNVFVSLMMNDLLWSSNPLLGYFRSSPPTFLRVNLSWSGS